VSAAPTRIVRAGARSLTFRLATAASDTLVVVVTARALGADGRGLYAIASFAGAVIVAAIGGSATALATEVAHHRASIRSLNAAALLVAGAGGAVLGLALAGASGVAGGDASVLVYPAIAAPVLILMVLQAGLFQAEGDVRRMHWLTFGASAVPLAALALAAVLRPGDTDAALMLWALAQWIPPLAVLVTEARRGRIALGGAEAVVRRVVRRGAPVSLANGIALLNYRVDLIVVAALLPLASVGRYSIAIAAGESLLILSRALGTGAYARIISDAEQASTGLLVKAMRHALVLLCLGGLVLVLAAALLVGPLLGSEFAGVWLPLALLVPGIVALGGVTELVRIYLVVRHERTRDYVVMAFAAMVVNLTLALVLVPPLGLAGAALSTSISYVAGAAYLLGRTRRVTGRLRLAELLPTREELRDYRRLAPSRRRSSQPSPA